MQPLVCSGQVDYYSVAVTEAGGDHVSSQVAVRTGSVLKNTREL